MVWFVFRFFATMFVSFGAAASLPVPFWSCPKPNASKPLGGYRKLNVSFTSAVYLANISFGTYNHNVQLDYQSNVGFVVAWKNGLADEDENGQRILLSTSADARVWNAIQTVFPNLTTSEMKAVMEPSPFIRVNGRVYAAASPGVFNRTHDASAQGSQCSLWPSPLDPRNCGPPTDENPILHYKHTLLLREVRQGGSLGEMFWASYEAPKLFAGATRKFNIPTLRQMDSQTQNDVQTMRTANRDLLCSGSDASFKCEICQNGCQVLLGVNDTFGIGAESAYWTAAGKDWDLMAYRCSHPVLATSTRVYGASQAGWGKQVTLSNIPNAFSNLNAGRLPDGRTYLLNNPVVPLSGNGRDPLTLATSKDGFQFDSVGVVMTCSDLPKSNCTSRFKIKTPGPSYPQGMDGN